METSGILIGSAPSSLMFWPDPSLVFVVFLVFFSVEITRRLIRAWPAIKTWFSRDRCYECQREFEFDQMHGAFDELYCEKCFNKLSPVWRAEEAEKAGIYLVPDLPRNGAVAH